MIFEHKYLGYDSENKKDEYSCNIINNCKEPVGYCKYYITLYEREAYIEFININYEHRRRGYATAMVKELQSRYELKWDGRLTTVGRKWYNSLLDKKVI